jgi:hypothetical protein
MRDALRQRLRKLEKMLIAVTFAEAGEFDAAREITEKQKNKGD